MKFLYLALMFIILLPAEVAAAPFCVAGIGLPPQCLYDDIRTCQKSVTTRDTSCTVNPVTVLNYSGGARYCRVTSYLSAECIFNDRSQCGKESTSKGALCIDRVAMQDETNPYRYDDRLQY